MDHFGCRKNSLGALILVIVGFCLFSIATSYFKASASFPLDDETKQLLTKCNAEEFIPLFQQEHIQFRMLPSLTYSQLRDLGLKVGEAVMLYNCFNKISDLQTCPNNCSQNGLCDRYCICDHGWVGKSCSSETAWVKETHKDRDDRFHKIFNSSFWGSNESVSGPGSSLAETKTLRSYLPHLFQMYTIRSVYDAPCGDVNWISHVDLDGIEYVGADIVTDLIHKHRSTRSFGKFYVADIVEQVPYKSFDLIISRDSLVHLNNSEIARAIRNFNLSGSKYLLTTTFPERINLEKYLLPGSGWRPLNLLGPPFSFPMPLEIFVESVLKDVSKDKSLLLWKLPIPLNDSHFI